MTRFRIYGSDTPFCAWLRSCKELPSWSDDCGFVAGDNDVTVHRYLSSVDGLGTREVQGLMQIEVKTRRGMPPASQMDTLSKLNLFAGTSKQTGMIVRFFGVFVLRMTGISPSDSHSMLWGVIPRGVCVKNGNELLWKSVTTATLISLLKFDIHPRSFEPEPFRRHHKTQEIFVEEKTPLGFTAFKSILKRS